MWTRQGYRLLPFFCIILLILAACDSNTPPPPQPPSNSGGASSTLPDLHIVGADLQKEDLDEGIYTIHLSIQNRGASTSNTFRSQCFWECTSPIGNQHLVEHRSGNGLASGPPSIATIRGFDITCDPLPSTIRLQCRIDVGDDIEESNEGNNDWSGNLGVPIVP